MSWSYHSPLLGLYMGSFMSEDVALHPLSIGHEIYIAFPVLGMNL